MRSISIGDRQGILNHMALFVLLRNRQMMLESPGFKKKKNRLAGRLAVFAIIAELLQAAQH